MQEPAICMRCIAQRTNLLWHRALEQWFWWCHSRFCVEKDTGPMHSVMQNGCKSNLPWRRWCIHFLSFCCVWRRRKTNYCELFYGQLAQNNTSYEFVIALQIFCCLLWYLTLIYIRFWYSLSGENCKGWLSWFGGWKYIYINNFIVFFLIFMYISTML
jgi:hypothetical protein